MNATISIVMPAFNARGFIAGAVSSVLAQTRPDWRLLIVADDNADYEALLAAEGLRDERFRFLSTGKAGSGASATRNIGLDAIDTPFAATLDADDRFKADKLARMVAMLDEFPIVTCALDVVTDRGVHLRTVGEGADRALSPGAHKFVNLSMDSMLLWDRRRCEGRYDASLPNMNDLDFLLQLYRTAEQNFHIGTPLHDYVKVTSSLSNSAGFTERMIAAKRELLARLAAGRYPMADANGPSGIARFLEISLRAEETYPAALAANPALLFEDHIEPMLANSPPPGDA